jgi:hypothetical protein
MNNSFSPKKLVSSRYSLANINSNKYQQLLLTGSTSGNTQGYVYLPYIMVHNVSIEDQRKILKQLRVEKINKLNNQNI